MDGAGNSSTGYIIRGGRMLNFSYLCTYELLSRVPSLTNATKTVKQEIDEFNAIPGNKTSTHARLVTSKANHPQIEDTSDLGLSIEQKADLLHLACQSEKHLGRDMIQDWFDENFFKTNFWCMWGTM